MRYSDTAKKIGKILKELRKKRGLLQDEVARILQIEPKTYSTYETGYATISIEKLLFLCDFYRVTPNMILGYEDEMPLNECLTHARGCGVQCSDKEDGFMECSVVDESDKMTSLLSYDLFIRLVNRTKKEANEYYRSEFLRRFCYYMSRYGLDYEMNEQDIINRIQGDPEAKSYFEAQILAAVNKSLQEHNSKKRVDAIIIKPRKIPKKRSSKVVKKDGEK